MWFWCPFFLQHFHVCWKCPVFFLFAKLVPEYCLEESKTLKTPERHMTLERKRDVHAKSLTVISYNSLYYTDLYILHHNSHVFLRLRTGWRDLNFGPKKCLKGRIITVIAFYRMPSYRRNNDLGCWKGRLVLRLSLTHSSSTTGLRCRRDN